MSDGDNEMLELRVCVWSGADSDARHGMPVGLILPQLLPLGPVGEGGKGGLATVAATRHKHIGCKTQQTQTANKARNDIS